jgi:mRNA interferase YafQ
MLTPKPTTTFKSEVQRLAMRGRDITKMFSPMLALLSNQPLLPQYQDHPLKGKWKGYREFHVEADWIVIYRKTDDFLLLERTGTHSDLFKS